MFRKKFLSKAKAASNRDPRIKIFAWAFFLSLICGVIELGQPLDDVIQAVRDEVRQRPASQDIVVVGVDDRTAAELGGLTFPRSIDAQVVDKLFAMGAKRIFYDRAYADATTAAEDAVFVSALKRHKGRIFLGAMRPKDASTGEYFEIAPRPEFRKVANVTSLSGKTSPFGLTAKLPYNSVMAGKQIPSMSTTLSGRTNKSTEYYRPDWAIRIDTIPTVSMIDIVRNKVFSYQIKGKDVIVGPTSYSANDFHRILLQGWRPGVYFHAVGAETLKAGTPQYWGWLPAFVLTCVLAVLHLLSRSRRAIFGTIGVAFGLIVLVPLYFDARLISVDVVPSALCFLIIAYRYMTLRRVMKSSHTNLTSGLPNLVALREAEAAGLGTLIALKLRNFAEIAASFDQNVDFAVIDEIKRRINVNGETADVYHSEDTLLWFTDMPMEHELAHHLEGLKAILSVPILINNRAVDVSIAFGVDADFDRPISSRVGSAMLCSEEAARGNDIWKFYDPQRRHEAAWQLSLLSRLDQAIDTGEVWVAYQSKLCLKTGLIKGAEALVRWDHPQRGRIDPMEFISVAETHNRIEKLTRFVLDQAVFAAAQIIATGRDFSIAVNLSVQLLQKPDLLDMVDTVLRKYAVAPSQLTLEVTETGNLDRHGPSIAMMENLVAHGIHVSIDDYGTGNATLDYLKILPSDEVKIDRQFIANIENNPKDRILVKSTIDMVHTLGRKVVAEGVETQSVLDALTALGCDTAQGYLIGIPVPYQDFAETLSKASQRKRRVH